MIGATNHPDMIDPAILRPGRLEEHIYVPSPDTEGRKYIFEIYLKSVKNMLSDDISLDGLANKTEGFVGADIEAFVRKVKMASLREFVKSKGC